MRRFSMEVNKADNLKPSFSSLLSSTFYSSPSSSSSFGDQISDILNRIRSGEFKIAVYGLGHVGASIASVWLRAGAHVIGVDKSPKVLENAKRGKTHVPEPGVNEAFTKGLQEKRFDLYEDLVQASYDSYFKMICVPVLADNGQPANLTAVKEVSIGISKGLKKDDVVALNPSVPPGTTEEILLPIIEKESRGLKAESDFYLIYNPERVYEGRAIEDIEDRYPAIVSGAGPKSLEIGVKLYSIVFKKGIITISNIRTAETEKLFEGVYRDVNIALANELAKFCEKVGVNFWEAREAANSQPFCHIHKPGVGVGGACIPIYPQFIIDTANRIKLDCNITKLARTINDSMPAYCVQQAIKLLNGRRDKKDVTNSVITLLGLAFRGGVSDTRLSPTYKVIEELKKLKVREIRIHDPLVKNDPFLYNEENIILTPNLSEALKGTDLIILVADHPEYSMLTFKEIKGSPIYDGRGLLDRSKFDHADLAIIGLG
ncbi:MAG: nucleotide sugar dehydrogenase [Nitrososphaeraceae archaeon]